MSLIEQRHPRLGQLLRVWRAHCHNEKLPSVGPLTCETPAELALSTVLITPAGDGTKDLMITASGAEVDALYGEPLTGAPVGRLAPRQGLASREALSAIETARPVMIEDDLTVCGERRRVARLYLPLANDDGVAGSVLCGVVAAA